MKMAGDAQSREEGLQGVVECTACGHAHEPQEEPGRCAKCLEPLGSDGDRELVTDGGQCVDGTEHTTVGEIDGHHVEFTVKGPEQQVLEDTDDRIGSDILAGRINRALHELKSELEDCNVDTGTDRSGGGE
jgi:hypothetical protein